MEALKKTIERWFPALKNKSFIPRLGQIVSISKPPVQGQQCTYKNPYYAVNIQPVDAHFKPVGSVLVDVVCTMPYAGQSRGLFALPDVGCIVEYTQSYCLPHFIHIRGIVPWGLKLAPIDIDEARWQQSDSVFQGYDKSGDWSRSTINNINDSCEKIHTMTAKLKQIIKVSTGGKVWLGNEADNVLRILSDFMDETAQALSALASHTHTPEGIPNVQAQVQSAADTITTDKSSRLDPVTE